MASTNPESMTNAQGEFMPHKPRDRPMEATGHKPGLMTSSADRAPEFHAKTVPPGTAPKSALYTPNTQSEIPGQANNENVLRSHGKESVYTDPQSTLPSATSADVHTGLGHPGQGQTSTELRHEGQHTRKKAPSGLEGAGARGGSELREDGGNVEFRRLREGDHPKGPISGHNVSKDGAESMLPVSAEEVDAEGVKTKTDASEYSRAKEAKGVPDRGAGMDHKT
ncbi:uncharacterized protein Z518_08271 [Rhinocladiella mackenziei CBS 650.93]|uniref:Uncharacterized protein n=1 Tax=Rhinocladiella mackenziei CBS 650.93 TaxID=1442369 RepID=A0A0D2J0A8_9EURO|nr:uncharacterized protein Z518_08271 [Rhinocladiella mackenziei CBS 650.93]KIX02330.1 hypothetical protein Z518_08271 [Rhinocladiella mackenziei CBS 650.93]